ncbi:response regulator [Pseudomonas sp. IAC-BECa141]|uniref:response regulator n=1 Tax=Pseudomonas sp. IAC-BECa141 TaxID=2793103 RepID=UPI001D086852|nr:response regulator [Pseudomonas sp. IAC-BECa141]UDI94635.1 response regulator [Pseudomonas sp. IAC-BECa141]
MNANWELARPIFGTVIVVEDDPVIRMLVKDILDEIGAKSVLFTSADEAFNYLLGTHAHCSLVIVDQGLPGKIQGCEFIEMVRAKWPAVRSILTSGHLLEPATIPAHITYLHKQWSPDLLITTILTLLYPKARASA